jgi:hypothetical protein
MHLLHHIFTGEDVEKDLVTVPRAGLQRYGAALQREEEVQAR